jgi:uncharacterized protein (DUF1330 family)
MPKGYFFVEVEITDPTAYEAYRTTVPDIISAQGGRILVRGGDPQPFDGVTSKRKSARSSYQSRSNRRQPNQVNVAQRKIYRIANIPRGPGI